MIRCKWPTLTSFDGINKLEKLCRKQISVLHSLEVMAQWKKKWCSLPHFHGRVFGPLRFLGCDLYVDHKVRSDPCVLDNLMRRGLPLVNWCCVCWSNGESMNHFTSLWYCPCYHVLCGGMYFRYLGFIMSCQVLLRVYCFVGEIGLGTMAKISGTWYQIFLCELFGRK